MLSLAHVLLDPEVIMHIYWWHLDHLLHFYAYGLHFLSFDQQRK